MAKLLDREHSPWQHSVVGPTCDVISATIQLAATLKTNEFNVPEAFVDYSLLHQAHEVFQGNVEVKLLFLLPEQIIGICAVLITPANKSLCC